MEWQRDRFTVSDDPARVDLPAICRLLWGTYWAAERGPEIIAKSIANSMVLSLFEGAEQIGLARLVTDRSTVAYLCDVIISEKHQRQGLGKFLIECILAHPDLQECRIDLFTKDAQDFYRAFGFGPHRFTSMVRYPPGREPAGDPY